jgi:hypothetical protein
MNSQSINVGVPDRGQLTIVRAARDRRCIARSCQWHQHDADPVLLNNFTEAGQELDGKRVRKRVRESLGKQHPDGLGSTNSQSAPGCVGARIAQLFCGRQDPLA